MKRLVVVGASLAGLRAVQASRRLGYEGDIVWIGAEPDLPYDRPPLSKDVLAGGRNIEDVGLLSKNQLADLDVDLRLGVVATGVSLATSAVELGTETIHYDGLIVATGCRPRSLPGTAVDLVRTLRTRSDAIVIKAALDRGARRVVVIGAGFVGAEVAATCRTLGAEVTIVDVDDVPMRRGLGYEMGLRMAELHRSNGVELRLGVGVTEVAPVDGGVEVALADGGQLSADLVVVGIGVIPNTEWLKDSDLEINDGVVCDETLLAAPGVAAAGDVARWPNQLFGETMRVEHWDNAAEQGAAAAKRLLGAESEATPFTPVPWFWSDQFDAKIQVTGRTNNADEVRVVAGDAESGRFVAAYRRGDYLAGAFGLNWPRQIIRARSMIAESVTFDDAVAQLAPKN